ncbi:MAG TPA: hypothetical protein VFO34_00740 [Candidatus Acidoferrales bacterium]|nr:hypothetical protein [Candidatus Acidoferrales bacterium]
MAYPGSLGLGELLDRIFTTYRRNFLQLIAVAAIPYAALAPLLLLFVVPSIRTILAAGDTGQPPPGGFGGFLVGFFSAIAIMIFAVGISQVASMTASWELFVNGKFRIRDVYARVLKRTLALIAAGFLFGVIFFAGYLIVVVPGIIAALAMSLTALALVVENKGPVEAVRRSFDLTKGFRGRIFISFVICYAASMALIYALMIPLILGSVALAKPGPEPLPTWFWAVFIFVEMFALIVPAPLNAIALAVVYHDARRCKEGFDIQQLLDALPAVTPAAAPVQS